MTLINIVEKPFIIRKSWIKSTLIRLFSREVYYIHVVWQREFYEFGLPYDQTFGIYFDGVSVDLPGSESVGVTKHRAKHVNRRRAAFKKNMSKTNLSTIVSGPKIALHINFSVYRSGPKCSLLSVLIEC